MPAEAADANQLRPVFGITAVGITSAGTVAPIGGADVGLGGPAVGVIVGVGIGVEVGVGVGYGGVV